MRRWLSILMLVLLPFQFSWTVAATYDAHDSDVHGLHFGHHDHGHSHDAPDGGDDPAGAGPEADGHHCHGQCSAMPAGICVLSASPGGSSLATCVDEVAIAYAPPRPERPKWARLA